MLNLMKSEGEFFDKKIVGNFFFQRENFYGYVN